MLFCRASVTHISHNVAQACKDVLPRAVGDDRCDEWMVQLINVCFYMGGGKKIDNLWGIYLLHSVKKDIPTRIKWLFMGRKDVLKSSVQLSSKPKTLPPLPSLSVDGWRWLLRFNGTSHVQQTLLKLWSTTPAGRWRRPSWAIPTSAGCCFSPSAHSTFRIIPRVNTFKSQKYEKELFFFQEKGELS